MFSYNPLWKLLVDRGMTKTDLREKVGFSTGTLAQLGKNKFISMEVLHKICEYLDVQPGDIFEYVESGGKAK